MSREAAQVQAVERAAEALRGADLDARCALLGLPAPRGGTIALRAFATDFLVDTRTFDITLAADARPAAPADRILLLHFLQCDLPLPPEGDPVTFRAFPGGAFYWAPFLARTVRPLLKRFGNDLDLLRARLGRLDWSPAPLGDLGARIHAIGPLHVTLVYRTGDAELPPAADLLFDAATPRAYNAEDAAFLAGRLCLSLL